ncbi:hypothetical protein CNYM01_09533 [Colletotrichum nymphaeae SA-01]|uniref:Uncharacterized protein n=1 Tax=Colletotrichum nymphaeae SA-01 TaxID=1460502 RepID=A0A135T900_9PEZI|nr:hypothetical protein CNYM01_09533 [Colletotrichum nymphaeae SA-01]
MLAPINDRQLTVEKATWRVGVVLCHDNNLVRGLVAHPIPSVGRIPGKVGNFLGCFVGDAVNRDNIGEIDVGPWIAHSEGNVLGMIEHRAPNTKQKCQSQRSRGRGLVAAYLIILTRLWPERTRWRSSSVKNSDILLQELATVLSAAKIRISGRKNNVPTKIMRIFSPKWAKGRCPVRPPCERASRN